MLDSVNERIKFLSEVYSDKVSDFARITELTNQNVYDLLSGRKGAPSYNTIKKILSAFPLVSERWLILGEGEMYKHIVPPISVGLEEDSVKNEALSEAAHIETLISPDKTYSFLEIRHFLEVAYIQGLNNNWEAQLRKRHLTNVSLEAPIGSIEEDEKLIDSDSRKTLRGFIQVRSNDTKDEFLVALSNITSISSNHLGPGSVIMLAHHIDKHGDFIRTDLPLAKVKVLLEQAQQE